MKKIIILSIALIVLASLCFANEAKQIEPMKVRAGDSFTITLRANMSTGYQWQITTLNEKMLQLVNSEYVPYTTKRLGADGKQLWTFKALKAGETSITFKYVRPQEKDKPPEREQTIPVLIK
jgi:inhibitor of cysteine peptidase